MRHENAKALYKALDKALSGVLITIQDSYPNGVTVPVCRVDVYSPAWSDKMLVKVAQVTKRFDVHYALIPVGDKIKASFV